MAIETAATIAAKTTGFRKELPIVIQESAVRFVPARGSLSKNVAFKEFAPATLGNRTMPNPTFRRWTAGDIAKLKNMAQERSTDIAARVGRSVSTTAVGLPQPGLSPGVGVGTIIE